MDLLKIPQNLARKSSGVRSQSGFTLIEVMISLVVFSIFMMTVFNTYSNLVYAQKDTTEVRKMYSAARDLMATLTEDIKLGTVDYYYYKCESIANNELVLLSKDGLKRTVYRLDEVDGEKVIKRASVIRENQSDGFGALSSEQFEAVAPGDLHIVDLRFSYTPKTDLYAVDASLTSQLQPEVTVLAKFKVVTKGKETFLPLQTTVSSRVYTKVDQRDKLAKNTNLIGNNCVNE